MLTGVRGVAAPLGAVGGKSCKRGVEMESFKIKPEVYFGDDALCALEKYKNKKVFIAADPFVVKSGMIGQVTEHLKSCEVEIFSDIVPDPPIEAVAKGILAFEQFAPSVVVAVGGGSAIDAAKAIRLFAKGGRNCPMAAVPTTSGTGSEMTSFSVLTDQKTGRKYPVVTDDILPEMAILDVNMVKTVPKTVAADTGMDVLTHAVEAYVSKKANVFTDALAEKAVAIVFGSLARACDGDMQAKAQVHSASAMAGMAFNVASLGLNHAIAHNLGGRLKLPHGRVNAVLLPHVIEFNAEDKRAAARYARLSRIAGQAGHRGGKGVSAGIIGGRTAVSGVSDFTEQIYGLMKQLLMPLCFKDCGVTAQLLESVKAAAAAGALEDSCMATNPRTADARQIEMIIEKSGESRLWRQRYY